MRRGTDGNHVVSMHDSPTVAVAHYPEGAGHATRMLAVADALTAAGADVEMAGGGAGARFVALNGYDEFEPTPVDFIDTYQGGSMRRVLRESVPASADRVADYVAWLRGTAPDALVTDDMFAAIAATRTDVPLYALKHDVPGLYRDPLERSGARFHTGVQLAAARAFFYPAVWPPSDRDPDGATRVPPVALEGDGDAVDAGDVLVVPSHYSELDRVATHLRRQGYDVTHVGSDDWEPVPSLLPYVRGADAVVCSGYSTMMDAAVAGTPCIVHPATDEQEAVAGYVERADLAGFAVAPEPMDVLDAVADPPAAPDFENGAGVVAERVLADLRERTPGRHPRFGVAAATAGVPSVATAGRRHGVGTAAGAVATATVRARRRLRRAGDWAVAGAVAAVTAMRAVAGRCRRYGVATSALLASVATLLRSRARRGLRLAGRGLVRSASGTATAAGHLRRGLGAGTRTAVRAATVAGSVLGGLRRRVRDRVSG